MNAHVGGVPVEKTPRPLVSRGPRDESVRYRDFMGRDVPRYSAQDSADALMAGRTRFMLVSSLWHSDRVL
jgi:hypothetical protein